PLPTSPFQGEEFVVQHHRGVLLPLKRGRLGGGRPTLQQSTKPAAPVLAAVPPAGAAPRWPRRCAGGRRSPQGAARGASCVRLRQGAMPRRASPPLTTPC